MVRIDDPYTEESEYNSSSFDANISQGAKDSLIHGWDYSSMYHVKNFISVSFIEQSIIIDICHYRDKEIVFKLNKSNSIPWKIFKKTNF